MRGLLLSIWGAAGIGWATNLPAAEDSRSAQPIAPATLASASARRASPVDYFRQLLALTPMERDQALSLEAEPKRGVLQAKVQEYEKLPPTERELRLQLVELHFYLRPLMDLPSAKRSEKLAIIPEKDRGLIEERLRQWDSLPQNVQKDVLDNEMTLHYFVRLESSSPAQREQILKGFPQSYRRSLEEQMEKWRALPAGRRQKMYEQFNQFFDLPAKEKERTLDALPDDERQKMEQSLRTFEKLPPAQRQMCLESFRKFADLTKEERTQFLKNVERWQEMSPRERETWRNLVTLLPTQRVPPMPPPVGQRIHPPSSVSLPGAQSQSNPPPAPLRGLPDSK